MQDEWQAHPWLGTVLTASAVVAYGTAGYFTRLIELDIPTVLFWRGLYVVVLALSSQQTGTLAQTHFAGDWGGWEKGGITHNVRSRKYPAGIREISEPQGLASK